MRFPEWLWPTYGNGLLSANGPAADAIRIQDGSGAASGTFRVLEGWLSAPLFEIGSVPVTSIGLIRVVVIITVAWWLSKLAQNALTRISAYRPNFNRAALYTLNRLVHYIVLTVGFLIGLSSIGIDLSKFALFASALGVGVGFGLQNLISNFVAGLMLLFEKTLKVGDFIELESGISGEVREINIRSTLITTNDNIDIVVPNRRS